MAHKSADRVKETTITTGTGTLTLAGAVAGFQSFAVIGNGNTCDYFAENGTDWEVGIGTYTAAGTTLARTIIRASSNSDNAVNWVAGTKNVSVGWPAARASSIWFSAQSNTTQAITTAVSTDVTLQTETSDGSGVFATSAFTVPTGYDGLWHFEGAVYFAPNATGIRQLDIYKNDAAVNVYVSGTPHASFGTTLHISADLDLVAGDKIEINVYQNSGGNLNIGTDASTLTGRFLGPKTA